MFTLDQIRKAHSRVKSGADFPSYIQEIIQLGVVRYETHVSDNHSDYFSSKGFEAGSPEDTALLTISVVTDSEEFKRRLKAHQEGKTSYATFRKDCAATGIEKWIVEMSKMTCVYYDHSGMEVLTEKIPA